MRRHKVMLKLVYDMDDEGAEAILTLGRKAMKDGWDEDLDEYVAELEEIRSTQALYEFATGSLWMALREIGQVDFDVELVDDDTTVETYEEERA